MTNIPKAIEIEKRYLGALIHSFNSVCGKLNGVSPSHFYNPNHGIIYQAIIEMIEQGKQIDILFLVDQLKSQDKLEKVGGEYAITVFEPTTGINFDQDQEIIKEMFKRRQLRNVAQKIINEASHLTSDEIQTMLIDTFQQFENNNKGGFVDILDSVNAVLKNIKEIHKRGKSKGLMTGFIDMDRILGGLECGDLIIIGARPSMGKTSLALSILRKVAENGIPVACYSLEMTIDQLTSRLICQRSKIDSSKVKCGSLTKIELEKFEKAAEQISKSPICIEDTTNNLISNLLSRIRFFIRMKKIKLLIIDYLQLLSSGKSENRYYEITNISRSLKILAISENIPVIVLSQLNRKSEGRIPKLSDLRDSGGIEQDADKIIFIHRPELNGEDMDKNGNSTKNIAKIKIAKNRNGRIGSTTLTFIKETTAFENMAKVRNSLFD